MRLPELVIAGERLLVPLPRRVDAGARDDVVERAARMMLATGSPGQILGGGEGGGQLSGVRRVVRLRVRAPLLAEVDGVPGRQRAAPVEDHRVDAATIARSRGADLDEAADHVRHRDRLSLARSSGP